VNGYFFPSINSLIDFAGIDDDAYETGTNLCYKLAQVIQMLPSSSPRLHTLQWKLKIPFYDDTFPDDGYSDLIAAINSIHLPALATVDLDVDLVPDDFNDYGTDSLDFLPETDFSPFLASHPNIADLTLSALGTELKEDVAFLPRLRSFKGPFQESVIICARPRKLNKLVLTPPNDVVDYFPKFHVLPLASHLSLTKLNLLAVDALGSPIKIHGLSPILFSQLIASFPSLTHLDVCINKHMVRPGLRNNYTWYNRIYRINIAKPWSP
jgi:hypothetical protein